MKKVLAFFMILAMMTPLFPNALAKKAETDAEVTGLIEYLNLFDVNSGMSGEVTRADFVVWTARILNIDEYQTTEKTYYNDVPSTHWAATAINNLTVMNALTVNDEKMFYPERKITVEEAVKILLTVMGYEKIASVSGGYPLGYMDTARKFKVLDNVDTKADFTKAIAARLIFNALNANLYEAAIKDGNFVYTEAEGKTLLEVYKDIYLAEGRVEAVGDTALYPGKEVEKGITIGGTTYTYNGGNGMIGCYVRAYYKDEKRGDAEVVLVYSDMDEDDIIDIDGELVSEFGGDFVLKYLKSEDSSAESSARISKNAAFVYNGSAIDTDIIRHMNIKEGSIRLIRSKESKAYDVVIIRESETFVAGYVDQTNKKVYDSLDGTAFIDLSGDNEKVSIFDASGNIISAASIKRDSVLTIYRSEGKMIEIWLANGEVSGIYNGAYTEDGDKYFKIDDEKYKVSDKYYDKLIAKVMTGNDVTFKLDMAGRIACLVTAAAGSEYTFGYYISHIMADDEGEDMVYMRLYSADDGLKKFKLAERVKIDGKNYKKARPVLTAVEEAMEKTDEEYRKFSNRPSSVKSRILRYRLNDAGEINEIDTPYKSSYESENTLRITSAETDVDYIWTGIIGYSTTFGSQTVLFQVPDDSELANVNEKMFYSGAMKSLGSSIEVISYRTSEKGGVNDVVVHITTVDNKVKLANNIMFDKVIETIDEDDQPVEYIVGYNSGKEVQYVTSSSVTSDTGVKKKVSETDIERGDILLLAFNSAGEVDKYCKIYDCSEDKTYKPNGVNGMLKDYYGTGDYKSVHNGGDRLSVGYIKSINNNVVELSYDKGGDVREAYPANNIPVTVYDKSLNKNQIYKGSLDDAAAYDDAGYNCSTAVVHAQYVVWKSIYIYK